MNNHNMEQLSMPIEIQVNPTVSLKQQSSKVTFIHIAHAQNVAFSIGASLDAYIEEMDRISKIVLSNLEIQRVLLANQNPNYSQTDQIKDYNSFYFSP